MQSPSVSQLPDIRSPPRTPESARSGFGLAASASEPVLRKDGPQRKKGSRAAFLERQQQHPSIEAKKNLSGMHRRLIKDGAADDNHHDLGSHGREGFKKYLVKNYGTVIAGWRALDKDRNGKISFYELCNTCRGMGYHGNLKALWKEMDKDGSGFISIMEIDPEVGHYIGTFKLALMKKYGDMVTAWQKGIDTNTSGKVEENEIAACLKDLGITDLDSKKLFKMMKGFGPKGCGMTLQEFDPDAWNRYVTGDTQGHMFKANKEFLDDIVSDEQMPQDIIDRDGGIKGGAQKFREQAVKENRLRLDQVADAKKNLKGRAGLQSVEDFKTALVQRCGSLIIAWRTALDLDGNGRLTHSEFVMAVERLGFFGDVKGLWQKLDPENKGSLLFGQLDPETDAAISEMQTKLCEVHGNMLMAWLKSMDVKGTGHCTEQQFQKALVEAGVKVDAKVLFRLLMPKSHGTHMSLKDFDNKAYLALTRGDFKMITEQEHPAYGGRGLLEMTFQERQETGYVVQVRRSEEVAKRDEFKKACRAVGPPVLKVTPERFEELCCRKFGSLTAAWRMCLDNDGNGKLTFNEFSEGLRRLGYGGGFKALWKHYDCDNSGAISLQELDPVAQKEINCFLELLRKRYGDLDTAWRYGFNKDPHDSIDKQELEEACEALEYPYSAAVLVKNLSPFPGRTQLTIWDIDPECTRKRQRGQTPFFTEPKQFTESKTGPKAHFGDTGAAVAAAKAAKEAAEKSPNSTAKSSPPPGSPPQSAAMGSTAKSKGSTGGAFPSQHGGGGNPNNPGDVLPAPQQQLKTVLRLKYGSTAAAWRGGLDTRMQGSVGFNKFLMVVGEAGFNGNIKKLWEELTGKRAGATFQDMDADAFKILADFREMLIEKHGNLRAAWDDGLDVDALGRIDESEFNHNIKAMGLTERLGKKIFKLLLARPGQRSITVEDMQALLIGAPPELAATLWIGAPSPHETSQGSSQRPPQEAVSDGEGRDALMEKADALMREAEASSPSTSPKRNRLEEMSRPAYRPAPSSPTSPKVNIDPIGPREHAVKVTGEHHAQDILVRSLDKFKQLLVLKYGSVFSAWRHNLDVDQNGLITQTDFAKACQYLGVKAVQKLWAELDVNMNGQISLSEIDSECAEMFAELEKLLLDKCPTTKEAWSQTFDPENTLRTELRAFKDGLRRLGFKGQGSDSPDKLFKLLRPEPGRAYLLYEDLWEDKKRGHPINP